MQLAQEQEIALKEMLTGRNVFLTGEAGTGKSPCNFANKSTEGLVAELVRRALY